MARHLALLNRKLIELAAGKTRRLMVFMPPRHGKSELCSRFFPAWFLGAFPDNRVILTAYESDFAAGFGGKVRNVLDEIGPDCFGVSVSRTSSARDRWDIEGREGGMNAVGVGGAITGWGADLLIIDDPIKNAEDAASDTLRSKTFDWYESTAKTRLEPGGRQLLIMTRWHQDDLAGRLLLQMEGGGDDWDVVRLPAIAEQDEHFDGEHFRSEGEALWPARYPVTELQRIKSGTRPYWWNALYQQRPTAPEGAEFPPEYFGPHIWFTEWPEKMDIRFMAVDPSKGKERGDFSAIVWMGVKEGIFYIDADIAKRPPAQIISDTLACYIEFGPDMLGVEANAFQDLLGDRLMGEARHAGLVPPYYAITNTLKKEMRIEKLDEPLSRQWLKFKMGSRGAALLVKQLRDFPLGDHDDGPDALEMCFQLGFHRLSLLESGNERVAGNIFGQWA